MHIGLDLHGVIDRFPFLFKKLSEKWNEEGHNIHIMTGMEWDKAWRAVKKAGIVYHKHFSIVDFHKKMGTEIWEKSNSEGYWMESETWNQSKGNYAMSWNMDIHFDDSPIYGRYFPKGCTYIQVPEYDFDKVCEKVLGLSLT